MFYTRPARFYASVIKAEGKREAWFTSSLTATNQHRGTASVNWISAVRMHADQAGWDKEMGANRGVQMIVCM